MRFWGRVGLIVVLCAICVAGVLSRVAAESVTVTIGVGDTVLAVSGKTSPNAFVTIISDGNVIGTTTAAADGTFTRTFPAQTPGLHELNIFAHSTAGNNSDTVTLNINITEHATTTVDVFLPTTINIEDTTLAHDQNLNLSGETFPSSTVKVFIDNTEFITTTSDAQGNWNVNTGTSSLGSGQHEFFVRITDGIGNQSYPTALRYFTHEAAPVPPDSSVQTPPVPVITFPSSDIVWTQPEITITGTAAPNVQVELWDGAHPLGSVWSDDDGNWSLRLSLEARTYHLRARACIQGKCSNFSPTVTITYQPGGMLSPLQEPLIIDLQPLSYMIYAGQTLSVQPKILKGQPPYIIRIDWGDGVSDSSTHSKDALTLSHVYSKAGKYTAILYAEDAQGRKGSIQFTVEVLQAGSRSRTLLIILGFFLIFLLFIGLHLANVKLKLFGRKKDL